MAKVPSLRHRGKYESVAEITGTTDKSNAKIFKASLVNPRFILFLRIAKRLFHFEINLADLVLLVLRQRGSIEYIKNHLDLRQHHKAQFFGFVTRFCRLGNLSFKFGELVVKA